MVGYPKCLLCNKVTSQVTIFEFKCGIWIPVEVKADWNSCAVKYIERQMHGRILGHVHPTQTKKYFDSVFGADPFASTFYRDGIVVIPGLKMMGHAKFTDVISFLVEHRNLRERCRLQLLNDGGVENEKKTHHEDRRWINIWGDTNSLLKTDTAAAALLKNMPGLYILWNRTSLGVLFLPLLT
jgi:hypothetical protein